MQFRYLNQINHRRVQMNHPQRPTFLTGHQTLTGQQQPRQSQANMMMDLRKTLSQNNLLSEASKIIRAQMVKPK